MHRRISIVRVKSIEHCFLVCFAGRIRSFESDVVVLDVVLMALTISVSDTGPKLVT